MKKRLFFVFVLVFVLVPGVSQNVSAQAAPPTTPVTVKDKRPVIFIPGIMGSRLVNSDTGESVWVNIRRSKVDDLRLPMSANIAANKDKLVANQIVEKIKILKFFPQISVYEGGIQYLETQGYKRGDWENPNLDGALGDRDTYYLFAYDWRRDNVESAEKLLRQIDALRKKLGKPDLKFDVVAHSMGGLVARYAAMYGRTDLTETPRPTWEGTKYFANIGLFGTPNDGSMEAFDTMINGYSIGIFTGRRVIGVLNKEVALTSPALFQLLPHGDSLNFYDEQLQPMKIDIYDPAVWKQYGWSAAFDEKFRSTLTGTSLSDLDKYFVAVLNRAKRFHNALAVKSPPPANLYFFTYGSDCKPTIDGVVLYKEKDSTTWKTLTRGDSFKNSKGEKVDDKEVKKIIYTMGDGTVSKTSVVVESLHNTGRNGTQPGNSAAPFFACQDHAALLSNKILQESFMEQLLRVN